MVEESKRSKNLARFQIYERGQAYEPSLQMESMAELDDIDEIGMSEPAIVSFSEYRRLQDSRSFQEANPADVDFKPAEAANKVQSRTLNQSLVSRESKDQPTIEQSNVGLVDETFKQLQKGVITQEEVENVEDSRFFNHQAF